MASNTDSDINLFNPEKSAEDDMFNPERKFTERNVGSSGRDSFSDDSDCGTSVGGAEGGYARMGGDGYVLFCFCWFFLYLIMIYV